MTDLTVPGVLLGPETILVTPAQQVAAQYLVRRGKVTGKPVSAAVDLIAQAKPAELLEFQIEKTVSSPGAISKEAVRKVLKAAGLRGKDEKSRARSHVIVQIKGKST